MDKLTDYTTIDDRPYNSFLERSIDDSGNGSVMNQPVKSDGDVGDVWIKNFIRSENWQPKSVGFYLNGQTGYAEFTKVFISGEIQALTGIIGGFTIGATNLSASSGSNTTILSSGATAFSAGPTGTPTITITQAGVLTASGVNISGTITATAGTIGGWSIGATTLSGGGVTLNSSGSITGGVIQTSSSGLRTVLDGSTDRIAFMFDSTVYGSIYPSAGGGQITVTMETLSGDSGVTVSEGSNSIATIFTTGASIELNNNSIIFSDDMPTFGSAVLDMSGGSKLAIVPTSNGFNALYCIEAPEVWFVDFCDNKDKLDPLFEEVTVPPYHYIKCEGEGYQVWGKRKGHENKRFERKTEIEFLANERFLNMNKP